MRIKIFTLLNVLFFWITSSCFAQSNKDSTAVQKDIFDVLNIQLKDTIKSNLIGDGPFLSALPAVGYSMLSGFTGLLVANASVYNDSNHTKFSNLLFDCAYSEYHQYWFTLNSNIFIDKYKLHFVSDTRYYKLPTQTFGLGINSTFADKLPIDYRYFRAHQVLYRAVATDLFVGLGYNLDYHFDVSSASAPETSCTDFHTYEPHSHSMSSGATLNVLFDSRKNAQNPQNGYYLYLFYNPNTKAFGSDNNWQLLEIDLRHYVKFPANSNNILGFWSYNKLTFGGTAPYLDMPSNGWDEYSNTGRGYVPGRYTGNNLMYLESEYRFGLTRNGLLGGVVFCNATSVFQDFKHENHKFVPGEGIGLRIKMNKISDTNVDIDYGFGVGGSHGFNFSLGEMF